MTNPMSGELMLRNPFSNARIVGADIDPEAYRKTDVERGQVDYPMGRSSLLAFHACAKKWRDGWEPKDSAATEFGNLQDCRILTPQLFNRRYAVPPLTCVATKTMKCVKDGQVGEGDSIPWNAQSGEAKLWKAKAEKSGMIVLSESDLTKSNQALLKLHDDERATGFIDACEKQVMIVGEYADSDTGLVIPVKCLIDLLPAKDSTFAGCAADFKTARHGNPDEWQNSVDKHGYDAQAAMSIWLLRAACPERSFDLWRIVGQENEFPFTTFRRWFTVELLDFGAGKILSALKDYCGCLKADSWPDWDDGSNWPGLEGWGKTEPTRRAELRSPKEPMVFADEIQRGITQDYGQGIIP